jgi:flagella basal body P-ring formation protein FlgA
MIYIKCFLLFNIFFILGLSQACEIKTYSHLIKLSALNEKIIKYTDCSQNKIGQFLNIVNDTEGQLNTRQFDEIKVTPNIITIKHIDQLIAEKSNQNDYFRFVSNKILNEHNWLATDNNIHINMHTKPGNQTVKLTTNNKTVFIQGKILKKTNLYIANHNIDRLNQELSAQHFTLVSKYIDIELTDLFHDITQIQYYQTNKSINAGDILTRHHLSPIALVRSGDLIKAQLSSNGLKIELEARAKETGYIGQIIQIQNLQTNKTFKAKIIDRNKVYTQI